MSDTTDPSKTNPNPDDATQDDKGNGTQQTDAQKAEQERIDKIVSERLKREREKSQKEYDEKLKAELAERDRLAQLSAEEKEAEARKKMDAEMSERERKNTLRENRYEAIDILHEKGLKVSSSILERLVDVDLEKTKELIESFHKDYLKDVAAGVDDRLKGETPKDKTTTGTQKPAQQGTRVL